MNTKHNILGVGICLDALAIKALIGWKPVDECVTTAHF